LICHEALEGADITIHGTHSEETDLKDTVELINQKTGGKRKVASVQLDLRSEDECKKLVQTHLDAHGGKLDTLYVIFVTSPQTSC
jgi:NAD(P)-dependent dehydrogenase (short-subunit alcohol dehydrogenase family)